MKSIRIILAVFLIFCGFELNAQNQTTQKWTGETYILMSAFRLGTYQKERPTFFLEQNLNYRINQRFSLGIGAGIDAYPALLGFPLKMDGRYHFQVKSTPVSIVQSYGRYIKLSDLFFTSNRYLGEVRVHFPIGNMALLPRIGYNFLWDKYAGRNLSLIVGIGIEY